MSSRDALTCAAARALIQAELDRPLRTAEAAELRQHLGGCEGCRGYRAELVRVQTLLQEAGHALAHPPHAAPDLAPRVSRRMRRHQPGRMLFSLAQATAQVGGLALAALLAFNIRISAPQPDTPVATTTPVVAAPAPVDWAWTPTPVEMRVPAVEFEDDPMERREALGAVYDETGATAMRSLPGALLPD